MPPFYALQFERRRALKELRVIGREAGLAAIREAFEHGLSVYGLEDGKLVEYFPDGGKRIVNSSKS